MSEAKTVHLTAIGNILEALSTDNAIAVSLGLAVSLYKNRFLFGFGWRRFITHWFFASRSFSDQS